MCEKPSAFELFHSFWSFINILWGLVHKECNFDEKTRCGKNRPFFIDFFKKPYNLTLRSRQGVKIRLNTINMLEKVQLKAPTRLPKSFGQIREFFFGPWLTMNIFYSAQARLMVTFPHLSFSISLFFLFGLSSLCVDNCISGAIGYQRRRKRRR